MNKKATLGGIEGIFCRVYSPFNNCSETSLGLVPTNAIRLEKCPRPWANDRQ